MSKHYVRFLGDPTGYRVDYIPKDLDEKAQWLPSLWVKAYIGTTDQEVRVDLLKAYMVEPYPYE